MFKKNLNHNNKYAHRLRTYQTELELKEYSEILGQDNRWYSAGRLDKKR